ncbi:unnamed protein product [Symbiodinium microadriaticum]|nr:unnamed protein product [Symbiodinium microadriaticum]
MSLSVGLQLPMEQRLAGILVLSGYLPAAGLEDVPVLHCHGSADPMVRYEWAETTKTEIVRQGSKSYDLRSYVGLGHSLNQEEIMHAMDFLIGILPDDASFAIPVKDPAEMSVKELKEAIRAAGLSMQARGFCEKEEFVVLLKDYRNK